MNRNLRGVFCTLVSGIFWGFSGACSEYLFTYYQMNSGWLTVVRMLTAGSVLSAAVLLGSQGRALKIFREKRDLLRLAAFAVLGLMFSQYAYLTSILHSNAGTATVLQYLGPVMVMAYVCCRSRKLPTGKESAAIVLAVLGSYLLATHGNPSTMVLTPQGLIWGLLSAVSLATYTLIPEGIIPKWGSMTVSGFGMLGGGIVMALAVRVWTIPVSLDIRGWLAVSGVVIVGTILAYTMYLQGVADIGAVKASLIASVEPVSATLFSVFWLKNSFQPVDFLGFASILATVFLLTKKSEAKV